jgi:hypothetical protein
VWPISAIARGGELSWASSSRNPEPESAADDQLCRRPLT